ncbi:MAG: hypothetical protein GC129_06510 [Proteobacteria bacterium]|nr:hypothetical protein [Pseudomonadota bacterium]
MFKTLEMRWKALRPRLMAGRQALLNRVVSFLLGAQMQVLPRGHAGLAAALVLWFMQDGQRQVVLVRGTQAKDTRARLVSCMGLGRHGDLCVALRDALELQLGKVFARTIGKKLLMADRVAAAPLFNYTDEASGVASPVQVLAWVVQIEPVQLDLIEVGPKLELVVMNETSLDNPHASVPVSPTHRAIWASVQRHLPAVKKGKRADAVEEVSVENGVFKVGVRTVH